MGGEWPRMTLREANVMLIDCDHRTPPAAAEGYPYVAIPQLRGGRLDLREARRITPEHYEDWTRKARPTAHDVVLSRRCNPGETACVPPGLEFALGQNLVLLRADGAKVYPPFLRWLSRGPEWWEQVEKFLNVGAVFDSLRCADVPQFELPVPPLPMQRAIARILGALDDKIDLNRRMNETLEATARALFKSWFVDFYPVRAKAERRDPGLPKPIADEAHRSQYDFIDGFARHLRDALPNASFIGFTGTPIELADKNTRAVFGDYISVYDIQRAVEDGATVPIYYEGRLAALELDEREKPHIDPDFEEVTEGEEADRKEKLKSRWAQLEAIVGAEKRVALVAKDLVDHFEKRLEALDGKAMVVCMSRRICVDLYAAIRKLRPDWHADDDAVGGMKVVMTGSASDPLEWQGHIRNKPRREELAKRFRDPGDPFRLVIVRDMWLTGFDAPSLHTMYVDKPMRGHGLMQAIARVNRVFRDKPGGLVVDYLGLAQELKQALASYTQSGGTGRTAVDQAEAVAVLLEKHEVCCALFHRFDWSRWATGTAPERLGLLPAAQEHILAQRDGKARLLQVVRELSQAFALSVPHAEALRIRDDVAFFQAIRAILAKGAAGVQRTEEEMEHAIRQLISRAVASAEVVDIFAAAGLHKPDISVLSDEFLAEVRDLPQRNLAVELLQKLLKGELGIRRRKNVVQARSFAEMLEQTEVLSVEWITV